jgi:hypothetical protein
MDAGGDEDGAGKAALESTAEAATLPPASTVAVPSPVPASAPGAATGTSGSGEKPVKRMMKTPYQLEVLEKTYAGSWISMKCFVFFPTLDFWVLYRLSISGGFWFAAVEQYPSEAMRLELSAKIGLSDRQLQMWFCHRRLKDRKPPSKRQRREEESALAPVMPPPPVLPAPVMPLASSDLMVRAPGTYDEPLHPLHSRRGAGRGRSSAVPRISMPDLGRRYYEPPPIMIAPPIPSMQLTQYELRVINSVESQLGEPLREDGPALGVNFDPLPPGAFGAPIGMHIEI